MYLNIFNSFLSLFLISIVVTVHELGHYFVARVNKANIKEFSIGFGPSLISYTDSRNTIWTFKLFPLGGYVSCDYNNLSFIAKTLLCLGGPFGNFVFSLFLAITSTLYLGKPEQRIFFESQEVEQISSKENILQLKFKDGSVIETKNDKLKIKNKIFYKKIGLLESIKYSFNNVYSMITNQVNGLKHAIKSRSLKLSGPIFILKTTSYITSNYQVYSLIQWVIGLSVGIGVINLFILPPLDGGRIMYEFLKLFNKKFANFFMQVSTYIFLVLILFVLFNDISLAIKGTFFFLMFQDLLLAIKGMLC